MSPSSDETQASSDQSHPTRPSKKRRVVEVEAPQESRDQNQEPEPGYLPIRRGGDCKSSYSLPSHERHPSSRLPTQAIADQQEHQETMDAPEEEKKVASKQDSRLRRREAASRPLDQGALRIEEASLIEGPTPRNRSESLSTFALLPSDGTTREAAMLPPAPRHTAVGNSYENWEPISRTATSDQERILNWYYQQELEMARAHMYGAPSLHPLEPWNYDRLLSRFEENAETLGLLSPPAASGSSSRSTLPPLSWLSDVDRLIHNVLHGRTRGEQLYLSFGHSCARESVPTYNRPQSSYAALREQFLDRGPLDYNSNFACMPPSFGERESEGRDANFGAMLPPSLLAARPASNLPEEACREGRDTPWPSVVVSHGFPLEGRSHEGFVRRAPGEHMNNGMGHGHEEQFASGGFDAHFYRSGQRRQNPSTEEDPGSYHLPPRALPASHPLTIPPCVEGPLPKYWARTIVPLATDEDENWLSELLCFVRSELVEVFRANGEDVASRINSKKVTYQQVGIRCRYCAHLPHHERANRSSTFPSSIDRIYQSLTMMIREHFVQCNEIANETMSKFLSIRAATSQGATGSKKYWIESALKLGMVNSSKGIMFNEMPLGGSSMSGASSKFRLHAPDFSSFSTAPASVCLGVNDDLLVEPEDRELISEYLYSLMSQVQRVYLTESERIGSRKGLEVDTPGLGCRHCYSTNRKGMCRFYPAKRHLLPTKMTILHQHLQRCTLCPLQIKARLAFLESREENKPIDSDNLRTFFNRVWARLHGGIPAGVSVDCRQRASTMYKLT